MQLTIFEGLVQRIVFYGCELYAGQLVSGKDYDTLNPVYSIWLVNGILWPDATRVQHVFRLADAESGRGLHLVASLADEWGFYRTPAGKAVYFTLAFGSDPAPGVGGRHLPGDGEP